MTSGGIYTKQGRIGLGVKISTVMASSVTGDGISLAGIELCKLEERLLHKIVCSSEKIGNPGMMISLSYTGEEHHVSTIAKI